MKKIIMLLLLIEALSSISAFDEYHVSRFYCESTLSCDCIVITNNGKIDKHPEKVLQPARLRKGSYTVLLNSLNGGMVEVSSNVYVEIIPFIDTFSSTQGVLVVDSEITDKTFSAKLLISESNDDNTSERPIFLNDIVFLDDLWKEELKNQLKVE